MTPPSAGPRPGSGPPEATPGSGPPDAVPHGSGRRGAGSASPGRPDLASDLESFVREGGLWDRGSLARVVATLDRAVARSADAIPSPPVRPLVRLLHATVGDGTAPVLLDPRLVHDMEAIVYPRIWKIMEALRAGMPDGELRNRVAVLDRGVAGLLATRLPERAS